MLLNLFLGLTEQQILLQPSLTSTYQTATPLALLAATEHESHLDEELLSVLPDLSLVPEHVAEEGQARPQDQVELHLALVDQVGLRKLRDVQAPAEDEVLGFFKTCRSLSEFDAVL